MTVGIVDLDLLINRAQYKLSLDVMQLSAYHKRKGDKVKLCRSKNAEDLMWFDKLLVIYNGETEIFLGELLSDKRTTLIGKYFYGKNKTIPQEVIDTYPDKSIYESILESNFFGSIKRTAFKNILKKADFVRIHEKSNLKFISETSKELFIFDQDLNDNDFNLISSYNKDFSIYFPIEMRSFHQAERWINAKAFKRGDTTHMFLANLFIEKDLNQLLQQPLSVRKMFCIKFGDCSPQFYNLELKKFIRFGQKAKLLNTSPKIKIAPISDKEYNFLFDSVRRWYNGPKDNINKDIFSMYFKTKEQFALKAKIKIKDVELYSLLSSTLTKRYQDEQKSIHG